MRGGDHVHSLVRVALQLLDRHIGNRKALCTLRAALSVWMMALLDRNPMFLEISKTTGLIQLALGNDTTRRFMRVGDMSDSRGTCELSTGSMIPDSLADSGPIDGFVERAISLCHNLLTRPSRIQCQGRAME
jgi:hypothetical protein